MRHAVLALTLVAGCQANLDGPAGPRESPDGGGSLVDAQEPVATILGGDQPGVRRLTAHEIHRVFEDWLVNYPRYRDRLGVFSNLVGEAEMHDVAAYPELHNEVQVLGWLYTADAVADVVSTQDLVSLDRCLAMPGGFQDRACWDRVYDGAFRRLWRRPLGDEERERLFQLSSSAATAQVSVYETLMQVLLSPNFVFHLEEGRLDGEAERVRLTDHEVAARISFATTGSYPDDELAALADSGRLGELDTIRAQVERLIATEAGRAELRLFVEEWLALDEILIPDAFVGRDEPEAVGRTQPTGGGYGDVSGEALAGELLHFFDYVVWDRGGDFPLLMTDKHAFPFETGTGVRFFESALQFSYETTGYAEQSDTVRVPFETAHNPGLAFRSALLTSDSLTTQPIRRGVRILRRFLCQDLPSPGQDIVIARNELEPLDPLVLPNHEIVARMTAESRCQGCHTLINPVGFAFEHYDIVGRYRDAEDVRDRVTKNRVATHPVPEGPFRVEVDPALPNTFSSDEELARALGDSGVVRECMLRFHFRHVRRRREGSGGAAHEVESQNPSSIPPWIWRDALGRAAPSLALDARGSSSRPRSASPSMHRQPPGHRP
jgi:Protein of unknown function (DUF1588)/Protein of unknown function (DUF1592)